MHTGGAAQNKNIVFRTPAANTLFPCATNNFASFAESTRAPRRNKTPAAANTEQAFSFFYLQELFVF
jgi:hypothetical protein